MEYTKEIKNAMNYIENNLNEGIRLEEAAALAGFSKYHFQRVFKRETGLNLYEYIQKRRLAEASSLLLNSNFFSTVIYVFLILPCTYVLNLRRYLQGHSRRFTDCRRDSIEKH